MKKLIRYVIAIVTIFSISTYGLGREYIQPGEYHFGSCAGQNGGSVPHIPGHDGKHYDQLICYMNYDNDACISHAKILKIFLERKGIFAQCSDWLNIQVEECKKFMGDANKKCKQLDR